MGAGQRETLDILNEIVPLKRQTYNTGELLHGGWIVPPEWILHEAKITHKGKTLVSNKDHCLHVINYSQPFQGKMKKEELEKHVYYEPNCIPYKTSYYEYNWGMCMTEEQWESLPDEVEVDIDTEFREGKMNIGYHNRAGDGMSILVSAYTCHPQMVSNDLCAMVINAFLAKEYSEKNTKHNYCFLFAPETIGAIAFIDPDDPFDKAIELHCIGNGEPQIYDHPYPEYGGSSRQFELMGIETQTIMTNYPGQYDQYHTSLDNLEFLDMDSVMAAYDMTKQLIDLYETGAYPKRAFNCEPSFKYYDLNFNNIQDRHLWMKTWAMCTGKYHEDYIEQCIKGAKGVIKEMRELGICH
jgi:aminopeptidase-like protein